MVLPPGPHDYAESGYGFALGCSTLFLNWSVVVRPMEGDVTLPVLFGYRFPDASWWIVFGEQEVFQYTAEYEEHTTNSKAMNRMSFQTRDVGRSIDLLSILSADMPGALIQSEVAVEALLEAGFVTAASSEDSMKHLRDWLLIHLIVRVGSKRRLIQSAFANSDPHRLFYTLNFVSFLPPIAVFQQRRRNGCTYFKDDSIISYNKEHDEELKDFGFEVKVNDRSSWILKNAPFPDLIQDLLKDGLLTASTEGFKEFRQWYKPYRKVCEASDKTIGRKSQK
ncbi:hypothetical protein C8R42DRAFT_637786 [Lentinula raphanica]|nr:hypothetical protein C8R42DRAFT_637786 [Lentinula raphanica]